MSINFNATVLPDFPEPLAAVQRGLFFGDALFESIRVFGGRIPLLAEHWERLSGGLKAMRYAVPTDWSVLFFEREILRVSPPNARVRLTVWRSPGGLWAPENDTAQFLITAQAMESDVFEWLTPGLEVGCCGSVRLPVDLLSSYKTLNGARYVAAAMEARARGWDDGILLNAYGSVCEATGSNIFWFEGDALFTPPLSDGCVTGTMRKLLLRLREAGGLPVQEKQATFATLLEADEVFLSNAVRGLRGVRKCEGKVFDSYKTKTLHEQVVEAIFKI